MNRLRLYKKTYSNCSAQALVELAIFGSILLFCLNMLLQFGMAANYNQFLQMIGFRRAVVLSKNRNAVGANPRVNITFINDDSIPTSDDPFGLRQSSPYSTQASAVYSDTLYRSPNRDLNMLYDTRRLSGTDYVINERWQMSPELWDFLIGHYGYVECTKEMAKRGILCNESEIGNLVLPRTEPDSVYRYGFNVRAGYTTGGWGGVSDPCEPDPDTGQLPQYRQMEIISGNGSWWRWKTVDCKSAELGEGASVDVDDDFVEETIQDVIKQEAQFDPETGQQIRPEKILAWIMSDPDSGEINFAYGKPNPAKQIREPYTQKDEAGREVYVSQGLQPGYTYKNEIRPYTTKDKGTYTQHNEDNDYITTAFGINNDEIMTRQIKLNPKYGPMVPPAPTELRSDEVKQTLHQETEWGEKTPF